jgi:hypothetical protein
MARSEVYEARDDNTPQPPQEGHADFHEALELPLNSCEAASTEKTLTDISKGLISNAMP